jgi:RecB family exonuclease
MSMTASSELLHAVDSLGGAHPFTRKRLVAPDVNFGRELLISLARRTGGWIGWEATNLRAMAQSLAFVPLAEAGVRVADDVTINALVGTALERSIAARTVGPGFGALAPGLGFRRALLDSLLELRTAGVTPDEIKRGALPGSLAGDLAAVLSAYEDLLRERNLADPAAVFRAAVDAFEAEAPFSLNGIIAIVPARAPRGLPGRFHEMLLARGAQLLTVDEGHAEQPLSGRVTADFFAAATPSDELREVCRRVVAEDLRWDDVEIVATDTDTYGVELDALCQELGVGATMLHGIPLARTRIGRTLDRWFGWLSDGLSADVLRQALEAGELDVRDTELPSTALARELRLLRIGWGRARFEAAIAQLHDGSRVAEIRQREDESDDEFTARRASRNRACDALGRLLVKLLAITPPVPERGTTHAPRSSCVSLARATLGYLGLCPLFGQAEVQTMERVRTRLIALSEVEAEDVAFSHALAALREALGDLRAWPLVTSERKPWSAAGGMPHLTALSHAGTTGRRRTFIVGFDAERTMSGGRQDPLLPDGVRRAVGAGRLVTSAERREESGIALTRAVAGLRGRVTLSYATNISRDGREAGPSPYMLQAWRQTVGDASLSYEQLRGALRPPVSAVPARNSDGVLAGVALLDGRDVWLDALADGALLLDGTAAVRDAFPVLAAGIDAQVAANGEVLTAFHGLIPEAGPALDPTARPDREISPSALEMLAKCPLSWFYRHGLSLYQSQDPEYDEARWLDQLQRGSLLHEVFEVFTRDFQGRQDALAGNDATLAMDAIAATVVARWRSEVPPPAETVFDAERAEIHRAALAFLQMERDRYAAGDRGRWVSFELSFGRGQRPGRFVLPDGRTLLTHGRADRVDEMPDQTLRVIDYKTGKASFYGKNPKGGPFNGGRQLQPAIYVPAVNGLMEMPVSTFEYRFPTERGGNEIVAYAANGDLAGAAGIIGSLIAHVHDGDFIPTTDASDCAYCDYQDICRASRGRFGVESPRAAWAKAHADALPKYASMLVRRGTEAPE